MITIEQFSKALGLKYLPTSEQSEVITHSLFVEGTDLPAPLLVVAGAGSGKTETMSLRAAYVAATNDIDNSGILGLTFTRKAAAELSERLTERLSLWRASEGQVSNQFDDLPSATTYNSFALEVVREFGAHIGIDSDFRHLDGASSWQLMYDVVSHWEEELVGERSATAITDCALSLREDIWNQGLTLEQTRESLSALDQLFEEEQQMRGNKLPVFLKDGKEANQLRRQLLDIIERFEEEKQILRRLDFSDQVLLAARIVKESSVACQTLRERYPVVFLDEFQDTSVAQMDFLAGLFHDHPVTAVGDPNQAIYGWRGASAASLDGFHRLFTTDSRVPQAILKLSKAWRNGRDILKVANRVSRPLREDSSLVVGPNLSAPKGAHRGHTEGDYTRSFSEQIDAVVEFVSRARIELEPRNGQPATVAVLCRRRAPIMALLDALHQRGIPAETVGSDGLLFHPAIMDVRALLEVTTNIASSAALLRLLVNWDIGTADLVQLSRIATKRARKDAQEAHPPVLLVDAVDASLEMSNEEMGLTIEAHHRLRVLALQLRELRGARGTSIAEQVQLARRLLNLEEEALAIGLVADVAEALDAFERAAIDYESGLAGATMEGFLNWLAAAEDKEQGLSLPGTQPDPGAVQVMTVHASKGLEWDAVAVVDLESGVFPSFASTPASENKDGTLGPPPPVPKSMAWWKNPGALPYPLRRDAEYLPQVQMWGHGCTAKEFQESFSECAGEHLLAEERRLAYVAFTRPRFRLGLFGSFVNGRTRRFPSVFLSESQDLLGQWHLSECPTKDEALEMSRSEESVPFPKAPGKVRAMVQLSASQVKEEIRLLNSADSHRDLDVALATILDRNRQDEVRALLRVHQQQVERQKMSRTDFALSAVKESFRGPWILPVTGVDAMSSAENLWLDIRRPIPTSPSTEAVLGTVFHQWVEMYLRKLAAEPSGFEALDQSPSAMDAASAFSLDAAQSEALERLQNTLQRLPWLSSTVPLALEWPFTLSREGILVRGRIDAVLQDKESGRVFLVDWKTGAGGNLRNLEVVRRHLTQLSLYQMAWEDSQTESEAEVVAALVFLGNPDPLIVTAQQLEDEYLALSEKEWNVDATLIELSEKLNQSERT